MPRCAQLELFLPCLTERQVELLAFEAEHCRCPAFTINSDYMQYQIRTWPELADWIKENPEEFVKKTLEIASRSRDSRTAVIQTYDAIKFDIRPYLGGTL